MSGQAWPSVKYASSNNKVIVVNDFMFCLVVVVDVIVLVENLMVMMLMMLILVCSFICSWLILLLKYLVCNKCNKSKVVTYIYTEWQIVPRIREVSLYNSGRAIFIGAHDLFRWSWHLFVASTSLRKNIYDLNSNKFTCWSWCSHLQSCSHLKYRTSLPSCP